jgi:hypothetical protein
MTRDERQNELVQLLKTNLPRLVELYKKAAGLPAGAVPKPGILASQLVKTVLDKEFPGPLMDSQTSNYSQRSIILRIHENIETSWRKKYEQYLDFNGREPRPIDERSLAVIMLFFVLSWGASTWLGLVHLVPAISLTTIVSFASIRFSDFNRAYQQYSQRVAEVSSLRAKTA